MIYKEFENKNIQSFEYETTVNSDGNILGVCELGKATIQLLNNSNEYSAFKGSWIHTVHGSFYVYDVSPVQEKVNIKLECYDIKYKLDTPYDSSLHSFPCTLKEWRNSIFDACGVTYDNSDFPNSNLVLNEQPYVGDNLSNRNAIALIAQAGASLVITDSSDKFYFTWFNETEHTVNDWLELTTEKELSAAINRVILGRGDVGDDYEYPKNIENPIDFRIDNNYILDPQDISSSTDLRETTIIPLYNQLNGLSYLIYNIRTQNINDKLSIKLGDKIKFRDIWGNELTSYVMSKKITYLGADLNNSDNYEITLSASEVNESSTELNYKSKVQENVLEISRKTDKNNATIEDIIRAVGSNGQVTAASIILAINKDGSIVKINADKIALEGITTINDGFSVDLNGKATMKNAKIVGGNIELIDDGTDSEHALIIYNEDNIVERRNNFSVGTDYSGKTITIEIPDNLATNTTSGSGDGIVLANFQNATIYYEHVYADSPYYIYFECNGDITTIYDSMPILWDDPPTNLHELTLPQVGKLLSINQNIVITSECEYQNSPLINTFWYEYTEVLNSTKFNSNGVEIKDDDINTKYTGHGMTVTDEYGAKHFNENGIFYQTNRGSDYAEFSFSKNGLSLTRFINSIENYLRFDTDKADASQANLECLINGEQKLKVDNSGLHAPNIKSGTCTLDFSYTTINFNTPFASVPQVIITPNTTTSGVIAPKVTNVTTTGFTATLGGSGSYSVTCDWIAIST